jgi:hypothetical protein
MGHIRDIYGTSYPLPYLFYMEGCCQSYGSTYLTMCPAGSLFEKGEFKDGPAKGH